MPVSWGRNLVGWVSTGARTRRIRAIFFWWGGFLGECPTRICKESELQSNHQIGPLSLLYLNKISYESAPPTQKKKKKKSWKGKIGKVSPTDNIDFFFFFFFVNPYSKIGLPLIDFFFIAANSYCEDFFAISVPVRVSPGLPRHIFASTKIFFYQIPSPSARPSECSPAFPPNLSVSTTFLVQISYRVRVLLWFPPNLFVPLILLPRFRCDQCTPVKVLTWSAPDLSFPVNILEQISTPVVYPFNLPPIHPLLLIFFTRSPRVYCPRSITFLVCHRSICYAKLLD